MTKLLLALLFVIAPSVIMAAPSCFPQMSPPTFQVVTGPNTPKIGEVVYSASPVGLVWGYTCQAADGKYFKVMGWGTWEQIPKDWLFIMDQAIRTDDAGRRALWDKYAVVNTIDERMVNDWKAVNALLPNAPVVPEWKVLADPFRADKKRLVYTVVNGKRGPATTQYVDAGAPCDPVTTITEFGPSYFMSVLGNPNLIARCAK